MSLRKLAENFILEQGISGTGVSATWVRRVSSAVDALVTASIAFARTDVAPPGGTLGTFLPSWGDAFGQTDITVADGAPIPMAAAIGGGSLAALGTGDGFEVLPGGAGRYLLHYGITTSTPISRIGLFINGMPDTFTTFGLNALTSTAGQNRGARILLLSDGDQIKLHNVTGGPINLDSPTPANDTNRFLILERVG